MDPHVEGHRRLRTAHGRGGPPGTLKNATQPQGHASHHLRHIAASWAPWPGGVNTDFGGRSFVFTTNPELTDTSRLSTWPPQRGRREPPAGTRNPKTSPRSSTPPRPTARRDCATSPARARPRDRAAGRPLLIRTGRTVRGGDARPVRPLTGRGGGQPSSRRHSASSRAPSCRRRARCAWWGARRIQVA